MKSDLSHRIQTIKPSATLAVAAKAQELKAQGKDIIGLGTGEPDFDTPEHIKQAAIKAMQNGKTKYTPVDGTPELKKAIVDKFQRDNQLSYELNQILVSCGAKQSFFNLAIALLNPGDEVLIPAPYWVSYPDIVSLMGAIPIFIDAPESQHYKITPEQLQQAITAKTKLMILNSPSNPTGMCYSQAELKALGQVLLAHPNIMIATDDIYEHIYWRDEPFANILMCCPELYDRTIVINGVSKAYAMTGWRIGYCAGPQKLIAAMKKAQSQSTSNPCSIAQAAATAALNGDQQCVRNMVKVFHQRHEILIQKLTQLPNLSVLPSDGTFYSFPNVQAFIDKSPNLKDDVEFSELLLNEVGVALVPGTAFGIPGCIRLSFACSEQTLLDALNRISKVLN